MTKRKVTKLFAVVALAATPSFASPGGAPPPAANQATAPAVEPRAQPATAPHVAPPADPWDGDRQAATPATPATPRELTPFTRSVLAAFGIAVPRTLREGSPAPGNVASRVPQRREVP